MSRSTKYNPFIKIAGSSDKKDKQLANRKFRRISKEKIISDSMPPEHIREVSNTWGFSSDGLACYLKCSKSNKEEDINKVKKLMRK